MIDLAALVDVRRLASVDAPHLIVDPSGVILWVNDAYRRFAAANGDASVAERFGPGADYFAGIHGPLRGFFERAFGEALAAGEPFAQEYECSSADEARWFRLRALPLAGRALLLEHSLVVAGPHSSHPCSLPVSDDEARGRERDFVGHCGPVERSDAALAPTSQPDGGDAAQEAAEDPELELEAYRDVDGLLRQCSNCRRLRRPGTRTWDWVPAAVRRPRPSTSHGICETCVSFYYGVVLPPEPDPAKGELP